MRHSADTRIREKLSETALRPGKEPSKAKPKGWYHPSVPERPQHPSTPSPRTLKDVRGAKPRGWYHPDLKTESVTSLNALMAAQSLWPTASHVEPHSSGGWLVMHSGGRVGRTYMDSNGHEMSQEQAEGPQRRIRYAPRKVRGRVMSRPVKESSDAEGWEHNAWTGHATRRVSHNIRVVREWEPREGSPGSYVGEYWGDHSLKYPVRAGRKQSFEDAVAAARRLEKKHGPHPERKA